jgi:hypothetical protein
MRTWRDVCFKPYNDLWRWHTKVSSLCYTSPGSEDIYFLKYVAVNLGIVDVQLMKGPVMSCGQHKQAVNWDNLGSGRKGILIINTFELNEALCDQLGSVPLDRTIWMVLNFIYSSTTNQCLAFWDWSKRPSVIVLESLQFRTYGFLPLRMSNDFQIRVGFHDITNLSNKKKICRLISVIWNIIGQWIVCIFGWTWQ